jgi:hypothetical protein
MVPPESELTLAIPPALAAALPAMLPVAVSAPVLEAH